MNNTSKNEERSQRNTKHFIHKKTDVQQRRQQHQYEHRRRRRDGLAGPNGKLLSLVNSCFANEEDGHLTWGSAKTFTVEVFLEAFAAGKPIRRANLQAWIAYYGLESCFRPEKDTSASYQKRRMEDLLLYHKAAIETGTSKSSKLLKVRHTDDNSKRCFLCTSPGSATLKIEASRVFQKQDIYATGGEDSLHTLDLLKDWTAGWKWSRPFRMHDPMNLVWLCHTHNIDFEHHMFGLTLGGLDNSVRFISFDESYRELVDQANNRLSDKVETYYDMSYVSRRAIGMRLFQAQKRGHFVSDQAERRCLGQSW